MTRIARFSLKPAVAVLIVAAAAFGAGAAVASHDQDVIHACASNSNGSLRLVDSGSECRNNERPIEWSKESPIQTPQACPAGQFVTGVNASGQLTCATPGTTAGGGGGGGGGGTTLCPDPLPVYPNMITTGCVLGHISFTCSPGFVDLNGVLSDGCEYGPIYFGPEVCDGLDNDGDGSVDELIVGPEVPNGTASCQNGTFVLVCNAGFADENGVLSDGCETPA